MSESAIREVIETAYIEGIFLEQDEKKVHHGFHPSFSMMVPRGGDIAKVDVDTFLKMVVDQKEADPTMIEGGLRHEISVIDCIENVAVARVDLYVGDVHRFTDFMALYRLENGWKIVNKVFHSHPRP